MLFLPRTSVAPYQVAIYAPGADAARAQSSRAAGLQFVEFLVRSGRAVAFPVYQQTYERIREGSGQNFLREYLIQRGQDVRRTVDYLETRLELDHSKIALYGLSLGAQLGPVYLAIEPRLRTGVLLSGGFETWVIPPETDPVHFTPRVTQPVLMVNGREDFDLPYETAQVPMFQMLGTAPEHKRHAVLEGGTSRRGRRQCSKRFSIGSIGTWDRSASNLRNTPSPPTAPAAVSCRSRSA